MLDNVDEVKHYNGVADNLLRHEKAVYSRLLGDLINTVKARAAGRLEGSRVSHTDLIHTPEFIFEETAHQVGYSL